MPKKTQKKSKASLAAIKGWIERRRAEAAAMRAKRSKAARKGAVARKRRIRSEKVDKLQNELDIRGVDIKNASKEDLLDIAAMLDISLRDVYSLWHSP